MCARPFKPSSISINSSLVLVRIKQLVIVLRSLLTWAFTLETSASNLWTTLVSSLSSSLTQRRLSQCLAAVVFSSWYYGKKEGKVAGTIVVVSYVQSPLCPLMCYSYHVQPPMVRATNKDKDKGHVPNPLEGRLWHKTKSRKTKKQQTTSSSKEIWVSRYVVSF